MLVLWRCLRRLKFWGGSDYRYFERFISVALVYWAVSIVIEQVGRLIEKKMEIASPANIVQDTAVEGGVR